MDAKIKPILQYAEEGIRNIWPDLIQNSFDYLFYGIKQLDPDSNLIDECSFLIENVYREGYKDGLALAVWLENDSPKGTRRKSSVAVVKK